MSNLERETRCVAHEAAVEGAASAGGVEAVLFADAVERLAETDVEFPFLVVFVVFDLGVRVVLGL